MKHLILSGSILAFVLSASLQAHAELKTRMVTYDDGETKMIGYLAYDDKIKGKRPGVVVVHEWWGHNDYVRDRARKLAELGYVAFAIDMYGDGQTADHPKDAGRFAGKVRNDLPKAEKRFKAALKTLKDFDKTDQDKIAAIGYCFGGGVVLEMARQGLDLDGVVSFHGSLNTANPAQEGQVKASVLVLNGADDPFVKPEQITAFKDEMNKAGVDYKFVNYPGAKHSFTNPGATENGKKFSLPLEYSASADKKSWQAMLDFFKKIF